MSFNRGDLVEAWFNTGAFGHSVIYGSVIAAGPKSFSVRWESGIVNRLRHDTLSVTIARNSALARDTLCANEKAPA